MERVYIAWTIENWVTVVLMAALGYLAFSLAWQTYDKYAGGSSATVTN